MADPDAAFLWETEAIRGSPSRAEPVERESVWVTLREAHEETGIPVETIRKWARGETVPSYVEDGAARPVRMVSLEGVHRRAAELGRSVKRKRQSKPASPPPEATSPEPQGSGKAGAAEAPPGTMLVPIDAWEKMLIQLGNLHEAGRELAEARERAARAETEARFLKERLAELRARLEAQPSGDAAEAAAGGPAESEGSAARSPGRGGYPMVVFRHLYNTWKGRPRG